MNTTTPPPIVQPPPPTEQKVRIGAVLRDVAIVVALTFIGGFVIGLAGAPKSSRWTLAIGVSNLLLGTVGFAISGCLAVGNRWRHIAYVGFGVWLAGLVNVLFFGLSIVHWFSSIGVVALMIGFGGAISYGFKRDK